jgi:neutral ceramidase
MYVDFSNVIPDSEFTNNSKNARTGPSCHGVAFFAGTDEGPGMSFILKNISILCTKIIKKYEMTKSLFMSSEYKKMIKEKYRIHGRKDILMETAKGRILGTDNIKNFFIPSWIDLNIKYFKIYHRNGSLTMKPWIPQILPIQLVILGPIAIAGIPGEITTIAAQRLRLTILKVLEKRGVSEIILSPFANAYCGYITTYEEYQVQSYEGGHTVYGEWTLAAFQTKFKELAEKLLLETNQREFPSIRPAIFTEEELNKRSFIPPEK